MKLIIHLLSIFILFFSNCYAKEVDIILIGGQSNATGQGIVSNIPKSFQVDTEVSIFYSQYLNRGKNSLKWQPLCQASETLDKFGVELSLGTALHKKYPDRKIALIKHGLSGSNLYNQWNPGNRSNESKGSEYIKFIETVHKGIDTLKAEGLDPKIRAMVWHQGEGDVRTKAGLENSKRYAENLNNLISELRKELKSPDMQFILTVGMPVEAARFPGRLIVRDCQREVAENSGSVFSVKGASVIEADGLQMRSSDYRTTHPKDDVHLGTFGILTLGESFTKKISFHLNNQKNEL